MDEPGILRSSLAKVCPLAVVKKDNHQLLEVE